MFLAIFGGQSIFAYSISEIDIVVKEALVHNPDIEKVLGQEISFDQVVLTGFLKNDNPDKCLVKVQGYIMSSVDLGSLRVGVFIVCVVEDQQDQLAAEVYELSAL